MKKLLTITAAVSALAVAAPAAAQYSSQGYANQGYANQGYANANAGGAVGISNRIAQLDARLQAGVQQGLITRMEAQSLRPQLRELRRLERQYSANGLTQQERMDLQQRIRSVRQQLRAADGGRFDRDTRYGSWNEPYYNDGYSGQGGPYEEVQDYCESRGGIGGVIDSVLGRDNCGGLRIGQRVSGNLYAVPSQYRYQYRDGNGVYYRSDGRQIYQIDARTNTVVRVYDMNR
jgi:hypothetical protein